MLSLSIPVTNVLNWPNVLFQGTPFAINKVAIISMIASAAAIVLFVSASKKKNLVPTGVQNLVEASIEFVSENIVREGMGSDGAAWIPGLTALFFFIFFSNLSEVIPFLQMPATARMSTPLPLAIGVWIVFNIVGIKSHGFVNYFKSIAIPPDVPFALKFLLGPLELISTELVRPFALAVRLFGNMLAGHLLLTVFTVFCEVLFVNLNYLVAMIKL